METIQDFQGLQYPLNATDPVKREEYETNNVEYATSTYQTDHDMFPGLIVLPQNDDDVQKAVKYAKDNGYPVAIMTGGHQYSGACSTHGKGIQLNLKNTYKGPNDLLVLPQPPAPNDDKTLIYTSVSQSLGEFNKFLRDNQLFVPHGQCTDVHVGGHGQTGGYGQLGRSFGLLGDHIRGIRMVNHNAEIQEITKESDPELFHGILGGSPGNFGVITHYTIEVHRDADHDFPETGARPHGYKAIWLYNEKTLRLLLNELAAMADDTEFPRNFDLCVSVLSSSFPMFHLMPELKDNMNEIVKNIATLIGDITGGDLVWPPSIVLYAQWVPMSAEDRYTSTIDAWFQKFRDLNHLFRNWCLHGQDIVEPMSHMTGEWLFTRPREFDHPYEKRGYLTNSTTLSKDNWADTMVSRISQILLPPLPKIDLPHISFPHLGLPYLGLPQIGVPDLDLFKNCFLSVQIQNYGGKHSQHFANRDNGTAYSWRDATICQTVDCFYKEGETGKKLAQDWQAENDQIMIGEKSVFSKRDRRVLWASYGDWDLEKSWPAYFEDKEKYERIGRARAKADPEGTFTPNPFNVRAVKE